MFESSGPTEGLIQRGSLKQISVYIVLSEKFQYLPASLKNPESSVYLDTLELIQ